MDLSIPAHLPMAERHAEIVESLRKHQVLIVIGDTGSGKTTQLPKMCLEAGRGLAGCIACTQPRRIAAIAMAERVGREIRAPHKVGYKIRFQDHSSEDTLIKFMTDGVLLAETRQDQTLARYDTIIVDEVHERSLNIDFLLGFLKNLLPTRPDLKVLISSATMDADKFSRHFTEAPVIAVGGRSYPIQTIYSPVDEDEDDEGAGYVDRAIAATQELASRPDGGDILVFMPTERDIHDTLDGLREQFNQSHLLLPLFSRLAAADQRRIFRPEKKRKIIVATNVAETSITVPGIRFVVDTGLARIARYNPRSGTTNLQVSRISQASCEQRRGRCGRTGPGVCVRLYSEEDFLGRSLFTQPEIQRSNLAEVILQMISLKLGEPTAFPFLDAPPGTAIRDGYRILEEMGALDDQRRLTANGRLMARLPLDPRISRMLIEGLALGVGRELTILAAALSVQDPRIRPLDKEHKADEVHRQFVDRQSDFLTLLKIWDSFHVPGEPPPSKSSLSRFCKANFLSWQRMREWLDVHEQLTRLLQEQKKLQRLPAPGRQERPTGRPAALTQGVKSGASARQPAKKDETPAPYAAIHKALTSGFLRNICLKKERNLYLAASGREVVLFPGSGLYNKGPQWAVAAEFVETTQLFARTLATIEVDWLEELGAALCKRSWSEPHWEKKSGQVTALERVTLFGLPIVAGRRVNYGRINEQTLQEAREIFIRSALVGRELGGAYPFMEYNAALVDRFQEMEDRCRRRNIVVDEEALFQFYDARLGRVYDRFTLNRLLRGKKNDDLLRMREEDICRDAPASNELYRFPLRLRAQDIELELRYVFAPGQDDDGVTVLLPQHLLEQLNPQLFEWLVPGLLPDKLLMLCKGLPRQLRRRLVPLSDAVERILDVLELGKGSLYQELERVILRLFQVEVKRTDWRIEILPPHLRMRFLLLNEQGELLHQGRSFDELPRMLPHRGGLTRQAAQVLAATPASPVRGAQAGDKTSSATVAVMVEWLEVEDLDRLVKRQPLLDEAGHMIGMLHATLVQDEGGNAGGGHGKEQAGAGRVRLCYLEDEAASRAQNRLTLQYLYGRQFSEEIKTLTKCCKATLAEQSASWLSLGSGMTASALRQALQAFLLDEIFATNAGELPDQAYFMARVEQVRGQRLFGQTQESLNRLLAVLHKRRMVQQEIQAWAQRARQSRQYEASRHQEYQQALEQIVPQDLLTRLQPADLIHKERYLQALSLRMKRAEHAPQKDLLKAKRLQLPLQRLQELGSFTRPTQPCCTCVREYREMMEEFRVSIFAPELGTAQPVSEQRLQKKWIELEGLCRRVE